MATLGFIVDAAASPDGYVATWRDGEIYIEPLDASPFSGPTADTRN